MKRAYSEPAGAERDMASSAVDTVFEWRAMSSPQSECSLLCLASEILEKVAYCLEPLDRYHFRSTCRQLRMLVDSAWKDLDSSTVRFLSNPEEEEKKLVKKECSFGGSSVSYSGEEEEDMTATAAARRAMTIRHRHRALRSASFSTFFLGQKQMRLSDPSELSDDDGNCLFKVDFHIVDFFSGRKWDVSYDSLSGRKLLPWLAMLGDRISGLKLEIPSCEGNQLSSRGVCLQRLLHKISQSSDGFLPDLSSLSIVSCVILTNDQWLSTLEGICGNRKLKELTLNTESPCSRQNEGRETLLTFHAWGMTDQDEELEEFQDEAVPLNVKRQNRVSSLTGSIQRILSAADTCLETLDIDGLLRSISAPLNGLHYPRSLRKLVTSRLGEKLDDVASLLAGCPGLEELTVIFRDSPVDLRALVRLKKLKMLTMLAVFSPDSLARYISEAFEEDESSVWPELEGICLKNSSISDQLLKAIGCFKTLRDVKLLGVKESSYLSEKSMIQICRLPKLRHLHLDLPLTLTEAFGHTCVDYLSDNAPDLETLKAKRCSVNVLSIPRLLRQCRGLKTVELHSTLALNTLDTIVMARSIAVDLSSRTGRTDVEVSVISGGSYESVARILDGIPTNCDMILSDLTDYCLHEKERCIPCRFVDRKRSLILGRKDLQDACVVFHCYA